MVNTFVCLLTRRLVDLDFQDLSEIRCFVFLLVFNGTSTQTSHFCDGLPGGWKQPQEVENSDVCELCFALNSNGVIRDARSFN